MLRSNLDELEQTIQLLQSENTEEFFDVLTRNKKYGRVDAMNGPILLEKYVSPYTQEVCKTSLTSLQAYTANFECRTDNSALCKLLIQFVVPFRVQQIRKIA